MLSPDSIEMLDYVIVTPEYVNKHNIVVKCLNCSFTSDMADMGVLDISDVDKLVCAYCSNTYPELELSLEDKE